MNTHPLTLPDFQARAAHEGRLRQHREVLRPQPTGPIFSDIENGGTVWMQGNPGDGYSEIVVPYALGDKLWVRETWGITETGKVRYAVLAAGETAKDVFARDGGGPLAGGHFDKNSRHHMPRWASRTTLVIRAVRIERLQEISEGAAELEGAEKRLTDGDPPFEESARIRSCRAAYRDHWNATHKPGEQWEDNPWVIVLEIEKETD